MLPKDSPTGRIGCNTLGKILLIDLKVALLCYLACLHINTKLRLNVHSPVEFRNKETTSYIIMIVSR